MSPEAAAILAQESEVQSSGTNALEDMAPSNFLAGGTAVAPVETGTSGGLSAPSGGGLFGRVPVKTLPIAQQGGTNPLATVEADAGTGAVSPAYDESDNPQSNTGYGALNVGSFANAADSVAYSQQQSVINDLMDAADSGGENEPLGPQEDFAPASTTTTSGSSSSSGILIVGLIVVAAIVGYIYYRKHHAAHHAEA